MKNLKKYLAEYKINGILIDELIILAYSWNEFKEKVKIHNLNNPMKYIPIGEILKEY